MITTDHRPTQAGAFPRFLAYTHMPSRAIGALNAVLGWQSLRRTERALESMPFEMRKDIGWPSPQAPAEAGSDGRTNA